MAENKKFIHTAIKKPGSLHKMLGIPVDEKIGQDKIREAAANPEKFVKSPASQRLLKKRANFAMTLSKLRK